MAGLPRQMVCYLAIPSDVRAVGELDSDSFYVKADTGEKLGAAVSERFQGLSSNLARAAYRCLANSATLGPLCPYPESAACPEF
jgi:hypothetical protein